MNVLNIRTVAVDTTNSVYSPHLSLISAYFCMAVSLLIRGSLLYVYIPTKLHLNLLN